MDKHQQVDSLGITIICRWLNLQRPPPKVMVRQVSRVETPPSVFGTTRYISTIDLPLSYYIYIHIVDRDMAGAGCLFPIGHRVRIANGN